MQSASAQKIAGHMAPALTLCSASANGGKVGVDLRCRAKGRHFILELSMRGVLKHGCLALLLYRLRPGHLPLARLEVEPSCRCTFALALLAGWGAAFGAALLYLLLLLGGARRSAVAPTSTLRSMLLQGESPPLALRLGRLCAQGREVLTHRWMKRMYRPDCRCRL